MNVMYDEEKDLGTITVETTVGGLRQHIQFQHGPVVENGVNGAHNEDVIELLLLRMKALNERQACRENSLAITKLQEALHWLEHRTALRVAQGVEGTEELHVS